MSDENEGLVAENTILAQGMYAAFFERNRGGIQYVDVEARTYYISRSWTLRGPVPSGVRIEHTGLSGYGRKQKIVNDDDGSKNRKTERTGGTHSKRRRRARK
jgi:monoamine oxidase